ncbi:MAG: threonine synthase [Caldiserica bacterium]|nr:threonine synthase [Caldisericota bacterium]
MNRQLKCITCGSTYPLEEHRLRCDCSGLLDVQLDMHSAPSPVALAATFESRLSSHLPQDLSGVWRYRELVLDVPPDDLVTFPEGRTNLYTLDASPLGLSALWAKHEGENPTGSFKDRGMTVAVSWARHQGARALICASTGNTSASLSAYGARAHLPVFVLIPEGKIAQGKLAQTLAYGAHTLQIDGSFDDAMHAVEQMATTHNLTLVNSLNPFRLEGQKTIILDSFFQLGQMLPDWIVVPGGNLGNTSAFGKALIEMKALGLIDRVPRLAVIQAEGASPFARAAQGNFRHFEPMQPETIATAIRIGNPVSYDKAVRAIRFTNGVVTSVTDAEILQAKHDLDWQAVGCEPASAATLAGLRRLTREHVVRPGESVLLIVTGNLLKDPDTTIALAAGQTADLGVRDTASLDACANEPRHVPSNPETIAGIIEEELQ